MNHQLCCAALAASLFASASVRPIDPRDEPAATRPKDLDTLKLPPGAVFVICKDMKDALGLIPDGIFLSPDKYNSLIERLEHLDRLAKQALAAVPTTCRLTGQLDGDIVRFQARFELVTNRPGTVVSVGCQRAWLKPGATLNDKLPLLLAGDDGLLKVHVDQPGVHLLRLELEVPVVPRGSRGQEQGFDFGLPGAAITTLDQFTFARPMPEVRLNGRTIRTKAHDAEPNRLEDVALGPANRLEMVWRTPGAKINEPVALEAEGRIVARIHESSVITDVDLTLRPFGGEIRQFQVLLPPNVAPEVRGVRDDRIAGIDLPEPNSRTLTVRFKDASAEPYKLSFHVRQPRANGPVVVGPFGVPGALRERGAIVVSSLPEMRLRYRPRGDVVRRELGDEARRENAAAQFTYGNLSASVDPDNATPMLEIDVDQAQSDRVELRDRPMDIRLQDLQVRSVVDMTLAGRSASAKQRLVFHFAGTLPRQIALTVPPSIISQLRLVRGGKLDSDGTVLLTGIVGPEHTLELDFHFPLPESTATPLSFSIPIVAAPAATQTDAKVRVWTEPGTTPVLALGGAWRELPLEAVADHDSLPALVAWSDRPGAPLTLSVQATAAISSPLVVERALITATQSEAAQQEYRAQFFVSRLNRDMIEIEFPGPVSGLNPEFFLDGKKATRFEILTETVVRLSVPYTAKETPFILEVRYRIPATSVASRSWSTTLHPPVLRGEVLFGRIRWQIDLPPSRLVVLHGGGTEAEHRWVFSGGLLTPSSGVSAGELQNWLTGKAQNAPDTHASLVCWQGSLASVEVIHVRRQVWLIACSVAFLALAFALLFGPLSPGMRWLTIFVLGIVAVVVAVWYPETGPTIIYGCEPGVIAVVLILGAQWIVDWRTRRRVDFLPGFRRESVGASFRDRDPMWQKAPSSTVDSPDVRNHAAKQVAEGGT